MLRLQQVEDTPLKILHRLPEAGHTHVGTPAWASCTCSAHTAVEVCGPARAGVSMQCTAVEVCGPARAGMSLRQCSSLSPGSPGDDSVLLTVYTRCLQTGNAPRQLPDELLRCLFF